MPGGSPPLPPQRGRREGVAAPGGGGNGEVGGRIRMAGIYCNPNAGLFEVAMGMGLMGGNIAEEEKDGDKK